MVDRIKKKGSDEPMAVHAQEGENHMVGIGPIRVLLLNDDGGWFAQGLEVDFVASGDSVEEVKHNFGNDLCQTLHENLRVHGSIAPVLKAAPPEFWARYFELSQSLKYWQVSTHTIEVKDKMPGLSLVFHTPGERKVA